MGRPEIGPEAWALELRRGTAFYVVLGLSREDAEARAREDNRRHFDTYPVGG